MITLSFFSHNRKKSLYISAITFSNIAAKQKAIIKNEYHEKNRNIVVKYYYILAHAYVYMYMCMDIMCMDNSSRVTIFNNIVLLFIIFIIFIIFIKLIYYSVLDY